MFDEQFFCVSFVIIVAVPSLYGFTSGINCALARECHNYDVE